MSERRRPPRPAAFLDRDGTLIEDRDYLGDPDGVVLLPGVAPALQRLNEAGIAVVVVTNQSGIGRGLITVADYEAVRARLDELLAAEGARIDASYYCPHHPDFTGPCQCRKPQREMYDRAIKDLDLDARHSVFAGDRWRDVAPASYYNARGFLVPSPSTPATDVELAEEAGVMAPDLPAALRRVFPIL